MRREAPDYIECTSQDVSSCPPMRPFFSTLRVSCYTVKRLWRGSGTWKFSRGLRYAAQSFVSYEKMNVRLVATRCRCSNMSLLLSTHSPNNARAHPIQLRASRIHSTENAEEIALAINEWVSRESVRARARPMNTWPEPIIF